MVSKCRSEFFDVQISKGVSIHLITYKLLNEAYAVQEIETPFEVKWFN
jgi:hypothetical protein